MIRLFLFIKKYHHPIIFFLLEIIAIIMILSSSPYHYSRVNAAFQEINGSVYRHVYMIRSYFNLRKVADSLMAENARLLEKVYGYNYDFLSDSNITDTNTNISYRFKVAQVVNNTLGGTNNYFIINKGSKDGIHQQMGVISNNGIAGILYQVSENYSLALSVLSKKFRVNAKILESGELGSLTWDGDHPQYMILTDIPNQIKIAKNQHVVVGPYSRFFPENTPIGLIEDFKINPNNSLLEIRIKIYCNLRNLQKVYLIENTHWKELNQLEQEFTHEK